MEIKRLVPGDMHKGMHLLLHNEDGCIDVVEVREVANGGDGVRVQSMHTIGELPMYFVYLNECSYPDGWRLLDHIDNVCFTDWVFHFTEHAVHP